VICPVYSRIWQSTDPGRARLIKMYHPDEFPRIKAWTKAEPAANSSKLCPQCGRPKRQCWSEVNCQLVLGQGRAQRGFSW
jgi:hypothetical protein